MDTQKIDWTQPLEAVHTDGRVVPVKLDPNYAAPDEYGRYTLLDEPNPDGNYTYETDGSSWLDSDWTIRNVAPKEVEWGPGVLGDRAIRLCKDIRESGSLYYAKEVDHLYSEACKIAVAKVVPTRTALEQRMEDLVRRMAVADERLSLMRPFLDEARAILAELEPVDEMVEIAKEIRNAAYAADVGSNPLDWIDTAIVNALSRGRALERGE